MALSINTNVQSLNSQRALMRSTSQLGTTFKRLSSGLRINTASDDAAGLSISTRMTAQIRGTNQAVRNANDAISAIQVAEGALDETTNALQRIRELAVQAANDTYTSGDREDLQQEVTQLLDEINRIAGQTEFNNQTLLSGTFTNKKFHIGPDGGQAIQVSIAGMGTTSLGTIIGGSMSASLAGVMLSTQTKANSAISTLDSALDMVSDQRAKLGAYQSRFESVISNLTNVSENTAAARSRVMDADIAAESANLTKNAILQQAGTAILAQANQQPQIALQLLG